MTEGARLLQVVLILQFVAYLANGVRGGRVVLLQVIDELFADFADARFRRAPGHQVLDLHVRAVAQTVPVGDLLANELTHRFEHLHGVAGVQKALQ